MPIRRARPHDLDDIRHIIDAAYAMYVPRIGRRPAPMDADYGGLIAQGTCFVVDNDGVLGVIVIHGANDYLLIENVAVSPEAQGRGVGRELLDFAEMTAKKAGCREVRLYTNEAMSENLTYYPRRGYREVERRIEAGFKRVFFVKTLGDIEAH